MTQSSVVSTYSSHDISTFLHHTEIGEAIKQTTLERETYLGVAKVYGLRNREYLMENLQGLKTGDRVVLFRKYNSEDASCTAVAVQSFPDDGSSIRIHTLAGLCLGYTQPPERYIMAELMKAGKHLYATVNTVRRANSIDELDTRNAVTLNIYWVEESNPLKIANTYEIGDPQYAAMEQNGDAIWLTCSRPDRDFRFLEHSVEALNEMRVGDRLRLIRRPRADDPWSVEIWSNDKKYFLGHLQSRESRMLAYMLKGGKHIYGIVRSRQTGLYPNLLDYDFDVYVEDK
ncbi:MAG: hypothetical protein K6E91_11750 [Butyrivibrio sp.]|nr:hypothetical protein [Butyrivibrio sp.]